MPPRPRVRFPHGLTKDPRDMSWGEKSVFTVLAGSVGLGIYTLVTDPWGEQQQTVQRDTMLQSSEATSISDTTSLVVPGESKKDTLPPSSETPEVLTRTEDGVERKSLKIDDGVTDISFGGPPPQARR